MVEFCYKVLAIRDPSMLLLSMLVDRSTMCYLSSLGSTLVKKDEFSQTKGHVDVIYTGVTRMTKFSMGLEIFH